MHKTVPWRPTPSLIGLIYSSADARPAKKFETAVEIAFGVALFLPSWEKHFEYGTWDAANMPSATSGRIVKTSRGSKKTPHQKNHRWESFSAKISKLHSLDPLRKVRRHDLDAEDLSATTSYLRNGLDKWAELNISRPYMAFKREINPLTESLAQILYHEDRIMDLLAEYIARHEKEALEPLLDLVTAFAHDLGVRFEKHYPRALRLIVELASKIHDVEAIEWTFAALAFLFKYLSRLLVPDLRPTYDAVAPLMGKARNPGHIARFAAEAMSFLVKKAAAPSHKDKALPLFVEHVRKDLESMVGQKQLNLYSQGVMTMFAEAIKGVGDGVHSTGPEIFAALLQRVPEEELKLPAQAVWTDVCCGVLTSVIHHANVDTFRALETRLAEEAMAVERSVLFVQVFGTMAGVRKGTRIHDWTALVKALGQLLQSLAIQKEQIEAMDASRVWQKLIVNIAIVWSQAPIDALLPALLTFNGTMTKEPLMRWYILFCSYLADLNSERFRGLFMKDFQKYAFGSPVQVSFLTCLGSLSHTGLRAQTKMFSAFSYHAWWKLAGFLGREGKRPSSSRNPGRTRLLANSSDSKTRLSQRAAGSGRTRKPGGTSVCRNTRHGYESWSRPRYIRPRTRG
jgi:U3 small nucleolar RNA-associated protein 20